MVSELDSLNMTGEVVVELYISDDEGQMQKHASKTWRIRPARPRRSTFPPRA